MTHAKFQIAIFCFLCCTLGSFCAPLTSTDIRRFQRDDGRVKGKSSHTELQTVLVEKPGLGQSYNNASFHHELQTNVSQMMSDDSPKQYGRDSSHMTNNMKDDGHADIIRNYGNDSNSNAPDEQVDHSGATKKTRQEKHGDDHRRKHRETQSKLKKKKEEEDRSRSENGINTGSLKHESNNVKQLDGGEVMIGIVHETNSVSKEVKPQGSYGFKSSKRDPKHVSGEKDTNGSNEKADDDEYTKKTARIVNGQPVLNNGEFPFVVDISMSDEAISSTRFCTGTLIKNDTVLTAAHCVINDGYTSSVFATVGRVELDDNHADNEPSMTFRTIASMVHPEYEGIGSPKDVAVLLLNESCDAPTVKLAERTPGSGEEAWVVGYGIQRIGTLEEVAQPVEILSGRLQKTKLQIVSRSDCDVPQAELHTKEGLLCTKGVKLGASACMGDSGGGLFMKRHEMVKQVGIVSYGDSQCASEESGVFTDIAHVREWIEYAVDRMRKALGPTVQFDLDDKAEIVHKDHIGEKMFVHHGHPSSSHHAKFYTVRTNFSTPRHVRVSLCGGPSEHSVRLSVKNEKNNKVAYEYGACPDGKLTELTLRGMKKDEVIIGVNGNNSMPIRLSFSSSKAK